MKKKVLIVFVSILIPVALIYLLVPNLIQLHSKLSFPANREAVLRLVSDQQNWSKWWPADLDVADSLLRYNESLYRIDEKQQLSVTISIAENNVTAKTSLAILPVNTDSVSLNWKGLMISSYNPIKRVQAYFKAKELQRDMGTVLKRMQLFFTNPDKVYGIYIRQELIRDSLLISTLASTGTYPSTSFIYGLFNQLKNYSTVHAARITGYPMVNITMEDSSRYLVRVAIPVDRDMPASGNIVIKRMVTGAKILTAEITGGQAAAEKGFTQIKTFVTDYKISAPAIPFFSFITDRLQEPDSSRWITKIYYPVM